MARMTSPRPAAGDKELARARRAAEDAEKHARRWRDARQRWEAQGLYQTRAEFEAGEPCRGCGLPVSDGLAPFPPLLQMSAAQRAAYDDHDHYGLTTECEECGGEVRGVIAQVKTGTAEEVARQEKAAAKPAGSAAAPGQPDRPSKQTARRKLREAEAQAAALRIQLAQMEAPPPTPRPG